MIVNQSWTVGGPFSADSNVMVLVCLCHPRARLKLTHKFG